MSVDNKQREEKQKLISGLPANDEWSEAQNNKPSLQYKIGHRKCTPRFGVILTTVLVLALAVSVVLYMTLRKTPSSSSATSSTRALSQDMQWRLDDWSQGKGGCSRTGLFTDSNEYLNMTETQMVFFAAQGTQRQRMDQFTDDKYVYRPRYVRKELRQLTDQEWDRYVQAFLATSHTFPGGDLEEQHNHRNFSQYQIFLALHNRVNSPGAHFGAAFAGWHREYLLRFERVLREHEPDVAIPYWDSSLDADLPDLADSVIFSDLFHGGLEGTVTNGRFPNFPSVPGCHCIGHNNVRNGSDQMAFFTEDQLDDLASKPNFREFIFGSGANISATNLQRYHARVHASIGGMMGYPNCAPSDPIFWNHHSFVDLIYEEYRLKHPNYLEQYPDGIHADHPSLKIQEPYEPMIPFEPLVNIQGYSDMYTGVLYHFSQRPSLIQCTSDSDCDSKYLWCDQPISKCKSKVMTNCTGLDERACFCSTGSPVCFNDACQCI